MAIGFPGWRLCRLDSLGPPPAGCPASDWWKRAERRACQRPSVPGSKERWNCFLHPWGRIAVNIKSPRVDELIGQLRQLTGRGATEIVREALEEELRRQRRLQRIERLRQQLPALQQQAAAQVRPFAAESLYDSHGLPG